MSPGRSRIAGSGPGARNPIAVLLALSWITVLAAPAASGGRDASGATESVPPAAVPEKALELMADAFTENVGQLRNPEVRFYSSSGNMQVGFVDSAVLLKLVERPPALSPADERPDTLDVRSLPKPTPARGIILRLSFDGANVVTSSSGDLATTTSPRISFGPLWNPWPAATTA